MTKEQMDYFNRLANVMPCDGLIIGREVTNGMEHIIISLNNEVLYSFWNNPKKKPRDKPPKHTGGKPSYVKLLIKEMQQHNDLSVEASGLIQKVIPNIHWGDNLLIDTRSKKSLVIDDICKIIGKSKPVTLKIIKELRESNLIIKDKEGYKLSSNLIQKGGKKP